MSETIACDVNPHLVTGKYYTVGVSETKNGMTVQPQKPKDICEACLLDWFRKETGHRVV